jgi:hypothetical protein
VGGRPRGDEDLQNRDARKLVPIPAVDCVGDILQSRLIVVDAQRKGDLPWKPVDAPGYRIRVQGQGVVLAGYFFFFDSPGTSSPVPVAGGPAGERICWRSNEDVNEGDNSVDIYYFTDSHCDTAVGTEVGPGTRQ